VLEAINFRSGTLIGNNKKLDLCTTIRPFLVFCERFYSILNTTHFGKGVSVGIYDLKVEFYSGAE
jgi:hypothetical protein